MINQLALKQDLQSLNPNEFYMKHIVKSNNWYFSEYLKTPPTEIIDKLDYFKEIVSRHFGISFHSLQIVGSAKIGYSLSPKKLLSPFHEESPHGKSSDIDVAIVSDKWYADVWGNLRRVEGIYNRIYYRAAYKSIVTEIFRGYINDFRLDQIDEFGTEWKKTISPLNKLLQDKIGILHPLTYRIYRSWEDLEDYQMIGIARAKKQLEVTSNV
jgi:hypothetical protein